MHAVNHLTGNHCWDSPCNLQKGDKLNKNAQSVASIDVLPCKNQVLSEYCTQSFK